MKNKFLKYILFLFFLFVGVGQMQAYTLYFYIGRQTGWRSDGAVFKLNSSNAEGGTTISRIGSTDWYSCSTTADGTMYFVRCNSAGNEKWNSFSCSISSTNNVVRLTDWNAGELFSMYVTGDSWNSIGNWDNANANGKMTISSTNTFSKTFTNVTTSNHQFKIVEQGRWDYAIGWGGTITNTNCTIANASGNIQFMPGYGTGETTITYNISTGAITISCPPTPRAILTCDALEVAKNGTIHLTATLEGAVLGGSSPYALYTKEPGESNFDEGKYFTTSSWNGNRTISKIGTYQYYILLKDALGNWWQSNTITVYVYDEYTFKVLDKVGWGEMKLHHWNTDLPSTNTTFPGIATTDLGNGWYEVTVQSNWTGFTLAKDGSHQTADLTPSTFSGGGCWQNQNPNQSALAGIGNCIIVEGLESSYSTTPGEVVVISPTIYYPDPSELTYNWHFVGGNTSGMTLEGATTPSVVVNPHDTNTGTATLILTISAGGSPIYNSNNITIEARAGIVVRFNTTEVANANDGNSWGNGMLVHYWGDGISSGNATTTAEGNDWYRAVLTLDNNGKINFQARTIADPGSNTDMCSIDITNVSESGCYIVRNAKNASWYRLCDKTEDCQLYYAIASEANGQTYYSNKFFKDGDDISFYAKVGGTLKLMRHNNGNGWNYVKTINPSFSKDTVYTATYIKSGKTTSSPLTIYSGDYYLYSDAVAASANHSLSSDNTFTYFAEGNAKYTADPYYYYWVDWIGGANHSVTGTVGNLINHNLANEITTDDYFPNGMTSGTGSDAGANIRFAYNPHTNYFNRAALAGSSDKANKFLMLYDTEGETHFLDPSDASGNTYITVTGPSTPADKAWCAVFDDGSDWVYELTVKATGASKVICYALYNSHPQYLFGMDGNEPNKVQLINPAIEDDMDIRLIYDFKTNRIITAWIPGGTVSDDITLDASMMIIRKGNRNDGVKQITLAGNKHVSSIEQVYTLLELEGGDVNSSGVTSFFLALPYDCNVSDIFGIEGGYLNHWALLRYDGATRAQKGLFKDSGSYWTLVQENETLHKGVGYLLQVANLPFDKKIQRGNSEIALHRLYFPSSKLKGITLQNESIEIEVPEHTYTGPTHSGNNIDHTQSDRDWNLVGVPCYSDITAGFVNSTNGISSWGTGRPTDPAKFYYNWNGSDWVAASTNITFKATYSYMMQWHGLITWASSPSTPAAIIRRNTQDSVSVVSSLLELQLVRDSIMQDRTYIQMVEEATNDFDSGHDMTKFAKNGDYLCTRITNGTLYNDLAANNIPPTTQELPLIVSASVTGEYTFHVNPECNGINVKLYDRTEDRVTDLDFTDYTTTLIKGDYIDRFVLQLHQKTGIETYIDNNEQTPAYSISQADGKVFINGLESNADVALYDMLGHILYKGVVKPCEGLTCPQQGLYLIRINNQTQHILIR